MMMGKYLFLFCFRVSNLHPAICGKNLQSNKKEQFSHKKPQLNTYELISVSHLALM